MVLLITYLKTEREHILGIQGAILTGLQKPLKLAVTVYLAVKI